MVKKLVKGLMWLMIGFATLALGAFMIAYIEDAPDWYPM